MEKFGWTYNELLLTPFHVIVYIGFIASSITAHKKLNDLKKEE
jgi:hypothetical protein